MTQQRQLKQIFTGNSEMAILMRSLDWSQTPLGTVETWTQSLRSTLSICLNSRFPIAIYWGQDCLLLYNDAWRPIVGDKHPWALGRPAREVWSEIWDDIGPELAGVLATGEGTFHNDELLSMHRFGYTEECFFEYTFNPIQGQGGVIDGVFNVVSETTYRVLNDRRARLLREVGAKTGIAKTAEELCYLIVEAFKTDPFDIPFARLYLIDQDGKHARLCGSTDAPDSAISPAVVDLSAADGTDGWEIAVAARTGKSQEIGDLESRFGKIPGSPWSEPPQEAIILPIAATGQGKVTGVLMAVASPRRRLDDHYRDFFHQVAGQIATAIANARAYEEERQRAEALAELDRAKTTFFTNISHEFRTPLTLMLSPLEELAMTLDGRLQPGEREQLKLVQRNGLRLQKLVNTLLDFSRIEANRVQVAYEPTDLATYTADLASTFRSLIEQAGIALIVDCATLPEPIYVDREMWEKIVLNLLSNAFKFTLSGTITVRLQWQESCVELSVSDTGVGIPSSELPHLFERFHRVENSQGRSFEGSGIGLSLVQELVKLHGGTIAVSSTFGQGSCFTVTIPTGTAHLPPEGICTNRTLVSTALGAMSYVEEAQKWLPESNFRLPISLRTEERFEVNHNPTHLNPSPIPSVAQAKILLADDNADMRDYIRRLLSRSYTVQTVADGAAALAAIQDNPPDLVLTDVMMPGMDGFELLRSLRSDPTTQNIPVILLSARAGEESRIEGLEAGANDYLIKPFSARELLARVEASLKLAWLREEAIKRERTLLERVTDAFMALDLDFRFTYANKAAQQVSQTPLEALLGKTMWECFPATVGTQFEFQYRRSLTEQVSVEFEEYYAPLDLWVEVHVYPSPTGLSLFFRDINARKQAEASLQASEQRFRDLADNAPMMVWVTDPTGYCTYLSQSWYNFSGQTEETALGFGWLDATHPDDRESSKASFLAANDRHEAFQLEYRLRRQDGEYRTCIDAARPWFDGNNQFKGYIGSVIDIHERKQAEAALRQSEERYRTLFESIDEGFTIIEVLFDENNTPLDYRFLEINPAFEKQTGLKQAVGKTARQLVPDIEDYWIRMYGQVVLTGKSVRFENGSEALNRWFDVYACRTGQPEERKVAIVFKDISDRRRAEVERDQLLQREQTAREAAERANQIKDEFLAVLSHELRSPLNPILGWSKLLQQGKLDAAKTTRALVTIERNAQLQSQLIDDLLDISRILRGKLSLNVMSIDLSRVILAALETVRLAAEAKSLQVQTTFSPDVGLVMGDAGRLQQVVWNLLSNAVKFTPQGGQIFVTLSESGTYAQIQVSDTGKGINPDFLPYVFDHFRQEDGATTRKFGGLGLGLAIASQIVELHGGIIAVESPGEGQGATFTVQIPLAQRLGELPSLEPSSSSRTDLKGIRVLVVDDEADSRELVAFVLEEANAIVTSVSSGLEAVETIQQSVPDLIVSDIGMPEMDGYMLLQQIRALEQGREIPAIALTAYAGEFDRQQAIAAGFQKHIAKPVEPEALIKTIVALVGAAKEN